MELINKYSWVIAIVMMLIFTLIMKRKSEKRIEFQPELKQGYRRLLIGYLVFFNIPILIMGIGNLTGITRGMEDYFHLRSLNPFVLIFHGTIVSFITLYGIWIFFLHGAEFLEKHPGLFEKKTSSGFNEEVPAKRIKLYTGLELLAVVMLYTVMWIRS